MATNRRINQGERLARTLQSDNAEFARHLGNTQGNWERHLAPQKNGFSIDGDFQGY